MSMSIPKAIEILTFRSKDFILEQDTDLIGAISLGIEALKRIQDMRDSPCTTPDEYLPGETDA